MPRLVFIHLLNNYSGSPKILSIIVRALVEKYRIDLITGKGPGFLSGIEGVRYVNNCYKWYDNSKFRTMFRLLFSQIYVFFVVLFYRKRDTVFYINTVLPSSAALACKISGKNFVWHIHENMNLRKSLYPLYRVVYKCCNARNIFVSEYLRSITQGARYSCVVYNCLDDSFIRERDAYLDSEQKVERSSILLVGGLRRYKGIDQFVRLAAMLSEKPFELVVSATQKEVERYFAGRVLPENLQIHTSQTNLHPFYRRAKICLQMSITSKNKSEGLDPWVETFGLTILEAMSYGVPCIVPDEGGPLELIDDGINGYTVNPLELNNIKEKLLALLNDEGLYRQFSVSSFDKSKKFDKQQSMDAIERYIFSPQ